ncbi:MAG: DUF86 domain-containing protein [Firmicutes bacterium]|nr:DUF86 domain-containing protein [Bacillota bacterium]
MLDVLLVRQRLATIASYLKELERLARLPREEFLRDKDKAAAAESYLRRTLEAIFDLGRHILAKTGGIDLAGEYKAVARGLAQRKVVDEELGRKLVEMAGYRNRLVHLYHEVTDDELYGILSGDLGDIHAFIREVNEFLRERMEDRS